MVTCETLLFCLQKDTRQCCDALARFCVIRPVGEAGLPTSLVFAAMAYHVVEPCSHKTTGDTYDKRKEWVINHGLHLPRCRGITMVRGRGNE